MAAPKISEQRLTRVSDVQVGSKIELENGLVVTIREKAKGFMANSSFLEYSNGDWSCLFNSDKIYIF